MKCQQLNSCKAHVTSLGIAPQAKSVGSTPSAMNFAESLLLVSQRIRSLNVLINANLQFYMHASAVAAACNY
jgi:hypothetical protein